MNSSLKFYVREYLLLLHFVDNGAGVNSNFAFHNINDDSKFDNYKGGCNYNTI